LPPPPRLRPKAGDIGGVLSAFGCECFLLGWQRIIPRERQIRPDRGNKLGLERRVLGLQAVDIL
jgi:hypothetical protein